MTKLQKAQFINSFVIKLIAVLTMTVDHVGVLLSYYLPFGDPLVEALRIIGRLSLPLFCLCIVEGVMHTKHFGKYMLKLGIVGTVVSVALGVAGAMDLMSFTTLGSVGNIFIDLMLGALIVYLVRRKEWYLKVLAILPVAFAAASFACTSIEAEKGYIIWWLPWLIRTQYGFYAVLMIVLFYFAYWASDVITQAYASNSGMDRDVVFPGGTQRLLTNVLLVIMLGISTFLFWLAATQYGAMYLDVQPYALIAGVLLLFYNGKRGYNSKWVQHGFYIYYPLHLAILGLIFLLLNL